MSESFVEYNERYPARAEAVRHARESGIDQAAIDRVVATHYFRGSQMTAADWLAEIRSAARELALGPLARPVGVPVSSDEFPTPQMPPRKSKK